MEIYAKIGYVQTNNALYSCYNEVTEFMREQIDKKRQAKRAVLA